MEAIAYNFPQANSSTTYVFSQAGVSAAIRIERDKSNELTAHLQHGTERGKPIPLDRIAILSQEKSINARDIHTVRTPLDFPGLDAATVDAILRTASQRQLFQVEWEEFEVKQFSEVKQLTVYSFCRFFRFKTENRWVDLQSDFFMNLSGWAYNLDDPKAPGTEVREDDIFYRESSEIEERPLRQLTPIEKHCLLRRVPTDGMGIRHVMRRNPDGPLNPLKWQLILYVPKRDDLELVRRLPRNFLSLPYQLQAERKALAELSKEKKEAN